MTNGGNSVLTGRASQQSTREELGRLAAALCDGELTARESLRLEELTRDPEALAFLSRYLMLVGELHWSSLGTVKPIIATVRMEQTAPRSPGSSAFQLTAARGSFRAIVRTIATIAGLAAAMILAVLWWVSPRRTSPSTETAARLIGSFSSVSTEQAPADVSDWVCGQSKQLGKGAAAWSLPNGNTWILEGPAAAVLVSPERIRLEKGRGVFEIASGGAGFTVETPFCCFIDHGTSFAIAVDETGAELHVLAGTVEFRSHDAATTPANRRAPPEVLADEASRGRVASGILLRTGQALRADIDGRGRPIAFAGGRFIRELPRPGSSAALQFAALRADRVLRVFSFDTSAGGFRDRITGEPLLRTLLKGGGDLAALRIEPGWGIGAEAVRIHRGPSNAIGVALQTEGVFTPSGRMSLEAVFRYDGHAPSDRAGAVGSLLATRENREQASFFLAAAGDGTLMHLFDARENWLVTDGRLEPGHWYYAAATFAEHRGGVEVDTWLADLSLGERWLRPVLRQGQTMGGMTPGPLAIGKGFDDAGAHAYAFPGAIDEIVLYNGIVGEDVFREHLTLLVGKTPHVPPLPTAKRDVAPTGHRVGTEK